MPPREQLAARLRERGNALFRAGNYSEAASVYTAGLNQLPRGHGAPVTPMHLTLRLNRAACCISSLLEHTDSRSLHQAVSDCRYVIQHCGRDTKQEAKAQLRLGRALLELQAASDLPDAIAAFRRFKTLQPHSDLARDYLRRAEEERKAAEQRCEASRARGKEHCEDYDCEVCGGPPEHYFGDVDLDWSQFDADGFIGDRDRYFVPPAEADRLSPGMRGQSPASMRICIRVCTTYGIPGRFCLLWRIRICGQDNLCRPSGTDGPVGVVPTGSGKRGATLQMPQPTVLLILAVTFNRGHSSSRS